MLELSEFEKEEKILLNKDISIHFNILIDTKLEFHLQLLTDLKNLL